MKPGRELDALVAEKVMGWECLRVGYFGMTEEEHDDSMGRVVAASGFLSRSYTCFSYLRLRILCDDRAPAEEAQGWISKARFEKPAFDGISVALLGSMPISDLVSSDGGAFLVERDSQAFVGFRT